MAKIQLQVDDNLLNSSVGITLIIQVIGSMFINDKEYEKFCTKVLKILFSNDLTLWREQQKSNDDLYRFDLICKIKDDVTSAFGKFIEEYFRLKYIIFEFKNYKDVITQKEPYRNICRLTMQAINSSFVWGVSESDRKQTGSLHLG